MTERGTAEDGMRQMSEKFRQMGSEVYVAQSFSAGYGTGNEQPAYFDSDGGLHFGSPPSHEQTTIARKGLYAYAKTTRNRNH
jgi:hypothetical protein